MVIPPRPRWGLIITVIIVDAILAAAGAWMLREGLAEPTAAKPAAPIPSGSAVKPAASSQAPPVSTPAVPAAPAAPAAAAATQPPTEPLPSASKPMTKEVRTMTSQGRPKGRATKARGGTKPKIQPIDPYADPNVDPKGN